MVSAVWPALTCTNAGGRLHCTGQVCPSALGALYRVRVEYHPPAVPRVYVVDPRLMPREAGGIIPHTYTDRGSPRPCLFYPKNRDEWSSSKYIAHTVIPWLLLWLHHYESWHVTGTWQGGGIEHSPAHRFSKVEPHDEAGE